MIPQGPAPTFASFLMGGFESACFSFWDGRQVDSISATSHDRLCKLDYELLAAAGIRTARDGFRWPLIEREPGQYDWSSIAPMIRASVETGTQVIWDLCHFGIPDCVDPCASEFPARFAAFAKEAARLVLSLDSRPQWWCPVNEISYWAFAAGEQGYMSPAMPGNARFLKLQFARAYLAAVDSIRSANCHSRFIATDPLICVSDAAGAPCDAERSAGFEAWDMLMGFRSELSGKAEAVDVLGLNYYSNNQWRCGDRTTLGMGQIGYRPLRLLLADVWKRYHKPMILSETGAEHPNGENWLAYVQNEVCQARCDGIPVLGICIYPVMDYPGWLDGRHCRCGVIKLDDQFQRRIGPQASPTP